MLFSFAALALASAMMGSDIPRPEHPRPDMMRSEWVNLNGTWEFAETDDDTDLTWVEPGKVFPDKIVVPFCRESKLSGLNRKGFVRNVWYRKTIERPGNWKTQNAILHIGAADWKTTVYFNGAQVSQEGGSRPLSIALGELLTNGPVTVVVHCFDDTRSGLQALGKQCPELDSYGCLYTRTTGIWQTVWLEGVGQAAAQEIRVVSDIAKRTFSVSGLAGGDWPAQEVRIRVLESGREVTEETGSVGKDAKFQVSLKIPNAKLWDPSSPHLYNIEVSTVSRGEVTDVVTTYAGMREVAIKDRAILINGKPVFQRLILDQGFYPDGVWTAPSDEALKRDIELSMAAGFNGARLHQKVFEPRFLYWADKLGYLVWGEYPCWGLDYKKPIANAVKKEWEALVRRDMSHPSIIGWCPFNETPAEAGEIQNEVVALTKQLDPTRPIIDTSGYIHSVSDPQVTDAHDYDQNPESFKKRYDDLFSGSGLPARYGRADIPNIPFMVSEYGGIGWDSAGGWGYGEGPKTLDEFYARFKGLTDALLDNPNMFGFCYTQLTDVEQEKNGIYRYDRSPKFDNAKLRAVLTRKAAIEKGVKPTMPTKGADWKVIVLSARDGDGSAWRSTTTEPAQDWNTTSFADASWYASPGGFGNKGGSEKDTVTPWTTSDIWLRQEFDWDGKAYKEACLAIHYDNATEVYVNGRLAWKSKSGAWNDGYEKVVVTDALKKALKKGKNLIAVHCHQDTGGQFIDLAVLVR